MIYTSLGSLSSEFLTKRLIRDSSPYSLYYALQDPNLLAI